MLKILALIITIFFSYHTKVLAHMNEGVFGNFASESDIKIFHSRSINMGRHLDLDHSEIGNINGLLGRNISFAAVNFKKIYSRLHSNRKGKYIGRIYRIEKNLASGKIVILLELYNGKLADVKITAKGPSDITPEVSKKIFDFFRNQPLKELSNNIASLIKDDKIENNVSSTFSGVTAENHIKGKEHLKRLEEDYSLLSLIQECLIVDMITS